MAASPMVTEVGDVTELAGYYAQPPNGVRVNMIFSSDGAAAFDGRAGPLSCAADQQLLGALRGFTDVVLVGAGTARAENYGPVVLTEPQLANRKMRAQPNPPPIAVVSRSGFLPPRLRSTPEQLPILITCEQSTATAATTSFSAVLIAGQEAVDVRRAVELLTAAGMPRILCEGGPSLLDELVEADAVDEICVTIAPKLAANQPIRTNPQSSPLHKPTDVRLDHVLIHQGYVFLKYSRLRADDKPTRQIAAVQPSTFGSYR